MQGLDVGSTGKQMEIQTQDIESGATENWDEDKNVCMCEQSKSPLSYICTTLKGQT